MLIKKTFRKLALNLIPMRSCFYDTGTGLGYIVLGIKERKLYRNHMISKLPDSYYLEVKIAPMIYDKVNAKLLTYWSKTTETYTILVKIAAGGDKCFWNGEPKLGFSEESLTKYLQAKWKSHANKT